LLLHEGRRQTVNFQRGDAGFDKGCQVVQNFSGQAAGRAHGCNACSVFVGDAHSANYPIGLSTAFAAGWTGKIPGLLVSSFITSTLSAAALRQPATTP